MSDPHVHHSHPPSETGHDIHDAEHASHATGGRAAHSPAHESHDKHAGHSVAMFRDRFWLSLVLTLPTLVWGHMLQNALGYAAPMFPGAHYIPASFGTAVFLYGGLPFLEGAVSEIRDRLPGMMTLIALAISVAFGFSAAVFLGFPGMPLWEELASLVTIMLLGHWMEMRSISQAQGAVGESWRSCSPTWPHACAVKARVSSSTWSPSLSSVTATWYSCGPARASRPTASYARVRAT